jgi:hypothetical protein
MIASADKASAHTKIFTANLFAGRILFRCETYLWIYCERPAKFNYIQHITEINQSCLISVISFLSC